MKNTKLALHCCGIIGLTFFLAGCVTSQHQTASLLESAGFKPMMASSPARRFLLTSLTPDKISTLVYEGQTYFVYPDQQNGRALVGRQQEFTSYRQSLVAHKLSDQNLAGAPLAQKDVALWEPWSRTWSSSWGGR